MVTVAPTVFAADTSRAYLFDLSSNGKNSIEVLCGDIITVTLTLERTDNGADNTMYAMQDEIEYDKNFFRLIEDSVMLRSGIQSVSLDMRDNMRRLYMNYVSFAGGEGWSPRVVIGSFQMEVIGTSGASKITNQNALVSTRDGFSEYSSAVNDLTVIVSSVLTVRFESNGGSAVPDQIVSIGDKVVRPTNPVKSGYTFSGWYNDFDLRNPWNFAADSVNRNMVLYAGWTIDTTAMGNSTLPPGTSTVVDEGGTNVWVWVAVSVIVVLIVLVLLLIVLRRRSQER